MALFQMRSLAETLLDLPQDDGTLEHNHIFEPEYHQAVYVDACAHAASRKGAKQLADEKVVSAYPYRGMQPEYSDDESDPDSLEYEGLALPNGGVLDAGMKGANATRAVCALKSISIRRGYIDYESARAAPRSFYDGRGSRAAIKKGDVLINSTGDGTIGRVAVFDQDFPAVVDGHITIVRLHSPSDAWFVAAYLLSTEGQNQIYRYINGSSGQVEIYPQDIARIWIPFGVDNADKIGQRLKTASRAYDSFARDLQQTLAMVED